MYKPPSDLEHVPLRDQGGQHSAARVELTAMQPVGLIYFHPDEELPTRWTERTAGLPPTSYRPPTHVYARATWWGVRLSLCLGVDRMPPVEVLRLTDAKLLPPGLRHDPEPR